jgi:glutamine synthetase
MILTGDILTSHDALVNSQCRATHHGVSTYCHWFQPLAASGVRHGQSGQVYNMMLKFDNQTNEIKYDFDGGDLVKGETDGSSYPNGCLRATHTAGGYLAIDTSSPIFLRGDTIFIPSVLVSYYGMALDEKTPLLRANDAISNQGKRLLEHLGLKCSGLKANIGLEQELVSRKILENLNFNRNSKVAYMHF